MSNDRTKIAWCDATWSPLVGCTKVSRGCANCYAERLVTGRLAHLYPELPDFAGGRQGQHVRLLPDRLDQPLRWRRPRRIFVNSMSDLFHAEVPYAFVCAVFSVMALASQHTFLVLTKRPEQMAGFFEIVRVRSIALDPVLGADWPGDANAFHEHGPRTPAYAAALHRVEDDFPEMLPLPNVWLGVSIEDQATADQRIRLLLQTPAALRWVSLEPQLEAVDLHRWLGSWSIDQNQEPHWVSGIDWVVQGGESGPKARSFDLAWARSVRDQCKDAGVPWFFKQAGANTWDNGFNLRINRGPAAIATRWIRHRAGADPAEWPADLRVQEWPS